MERQRDHRQKGESTESKEVEVMSIGEDWKVIDPSSFRLETRHIQLLRKGMSFSPTDNMDEFMVYKDVVLFLRKIFFKALYSQEDNSLTHTSQPEEDNEIALNILISLLEENEGEDIPSIPSKREADLKIKSWSR